MRFVGQNTMWCLVFEFQVHVCVANMLSKKGHNKIHWLIVRIPKLGNMLSIVSNFLW